jgi:hypothetical protein
VSRNLPAGTKENHKKSQERWCLQEKIWIQDLSNMKQNTNH